MDAREEVHRGPGISWRLGKLRERQWEDVFRFMPLRSERLLDLQKELLRGKWLRESGSECGGGRAPEDGPDVKWRMGELRGTGESERAEGVKAGVVPAMALGCFPQQVELTLALYPHLVSL